GADLPEELLCLRPGIEVPENKTIILYTIEDFNMNRGLALVGIFQVVGQAHKVDQLLVGSDLNTETPGIELPDLKCIALFLIDKYVINDTYRFARFSIPWIDDLQLHVRQSLVDKPQRLGCRPRNIDDPAFHPGAAIIHNYFNRFVVGCVRHFHLRTKGKCLMSSGKLVVTVLLAAGRRPAFKLVGIKGRLSVLYLTGAGQAQEAECQGEVQGL